MVFELAHGVVQRGVGCYQGLLGLLVANLNLVEGFHGIQQSACHDGFHLREQSGHVVAGGVGADFAARGFDQVTQNAQPVVHVCQRRTLHQAVQHAIQQHSVRQ